MDPVTRRSFLVRGSAAALGAAGVAAAGGIALNATGASTEPPLSGQDLAAVDGPVLLQVTDAAAGKVEVLAGEQEYAFTDRALVAKVLRATR
jgi:hypothetical protein